MKAKGTDNALDPPSFVTSTRLQALSSSIDWAQGPSTRVGVSDTFHNQPVRPDVLQFHKTHSRGHLVRCTPQNSEAHMPVRGLGPARPCPAPSYTLSTSRRTVLVIYGRRLRHEATSYTADKRGAMRA